MFRSVESQEIILHRFFVKSIFGNFMGQHSLISHFHPCLKMVVSKVFDHTLISRKIKGMENYLISTLYALLQAWHGILYHFISSHWNCYLRFLALTYIWTFYVLTRIHRSYPNTDIMRQRSSKLFTTFQKFIHCYKCSNKLRLKFGVSTLAILWPNTSESFTP